MRALAIALLLSAGGSAVAVPPLPVCYGYGCAHHVEVTLAEAQWRVVREHFQPPAATAVAERERIAAAVALLERLIGEATGVTALDRGGNVAGSGQPGQMDCIDESTNTDTYLRRLEAEGLLHHHRVAARVQRAPWWFDVHWGAVIEELPGGQWFVVDSWFLDNGREPVILPLEQWLAGDDPVTPPTLY